MLLSTPETEKRHIKAGHWGRVTIGGLIERAAARHNDAPFLIDSETTYSGREARKAIGAMAAILADLGVTRDVPVVVRSGNSAAAFLALAALFQREAVALIAPSVWSASEIAINCGPFQPRVILDLSGRVEETALAAAAELFTVRAVASLGVTIDGAVDLLSATPRTPIEVQDRGPDRAGHITTIHFRLDARGRPVPIARSHNHWIAAGLAHFLESDLAKGKGIATSMSPVAGPSLAAAVMPALLAGIPLSFLQPTSRSDLDRLTSGSFASHVVLPSRLIGMISPQADAVVMAVHPPDRVIAAKARFKTRLVDVFDLNHVGFLPRTRLSGEAVAHFVDGVQHFPSFTPSGAPLMTISRRGPDDSVGEIIIEGASIPDAPWPMLPGVSQLAFEEAGLKSGVAGRCEADGKISLIGLLGDTIHVGSVPVALEALDLMLSGLPGIAEAAAFAVDDPVLGARVHAALVVEPGLPIPSTEDLCGALKELGVSDHALPAAIATFDKLPRTATGALNRALLAPAPRQKANAAA